MPCGDDPIGLSSAAVLIMDITRDARSPISSVSSIARRWPARGEVVATATLVDVREVLQIPELTDALTGLAEDGHGPAELC
jgi:hypothetical protein